MKKFLAGSAIAATLVGGSAAIAAINPLGVAGANSVSVQAGVQQTPGSTPGSTPATPERPDGHGKGRPEILGSVLDGLVKDGTITQAQADTIVAKVKEKVGTRGGREGHNGRGGMGVGLEAVATELGMTVDEVKAGLKAGKSVADLAKEKGLDLQKVIDDLVAAATKKIDEAVAAGKVPADRAAKMKAGLNDHITKFVNEVHKPKR